MTTSSLRAEFHDAMYKQQLEQVETFLQQNDAISLLFQPFKRLFPIHVACIIGNIDLIALLIKYTPSKEHLFTLLSLVDFDQLSCLYYACNEDHLEVVQFLYEFCKEEKFESLFMHLALHAKTVDNTFLLSGSIPLLLVGGRNCFFCCAEKGNVEVLQYLQQVVVPLDVKHALFEQNDNDGLTMVDVCLANHKSTHPMIAYLQEQWKLLNKNSIQVLPSKYLYLQDFQAQVTQDYLQRRTRIMKLVKERDDKQIEECYENGTISVLHDAIYKAPTEQLLPELQQALKTCDSSKLSSLITAQPIPGVYCIDMLPLNICSQLVEELQHIEKNVPPQLLTRPNSMNNYGLVLNHFPMLDRLISEWMQILVEPISKLLFSKELQLPNNVSWFHSYHAFIVKYKLGEDVDLDEHQDSSIVTINLCLGKQFTGGHVFFSKCNEHDYFEYQNKLGTAVVHLGSKLHGATKLMQGERWNLIIWCRFEKKMQIKKQSNVVAPACQKSA